MKHYYSFDIFDTCFVRACGSPHNIFDLLAYQILGEKSEESLRMDFAAIRIEGERKARLHSGKKEVTLTDIYDCCSFEGLTSMDKQQIAAAEIEIEREQLVPVYSMLQKIEELHRIGESIYYISDMYLPQEFIHELLVEHGFWQSGDKLYVSCVSGKTKRDGSLFKQVAEENAIVYRHWHHWGDNRYSDYRVPKRLGIKAHLVNHKFAYYERYLLKQDYFPGFFVNQHMAGISKAVRLSFPNDVRYTFAADLIAPLYVPFVYSILKDASERGIRKLFFLARDGYILYKIAENLIEMFPEIEIRYIYVSRSALYLPGLQEVTSESIYSLTKTTMGFKQSLGYLLSNLVNAETYKKISIQAPDIVKMNVTPRAFELLFQNKEATASLKRYHDEQRTYIHEYFLQEGLASSTSQIAIVDVRGTRSCHQIINNILRAYGYHPIKGYYLEVMKKRKSVRDAGLYHSLFYEERSLKTDRMRYILELNSILEEYFSMSPDMHTESFRKNGSKIEPVFEAGSCHSERLKIASQHVEVMKLYCQAFLSNRLYLHCSLMLGIKLLLAFGKLPNHFYLKAFRNITVNNSRQKQTFIVKNISLTDIIHHRIGYMRGALIYTFRVPCIEKIVSVLITIKRRVANKFKGTNKI